MAIEFMIGDELTRPLFLFWGTVFLGAQNGKP
jgi:hypothetical protein